MRLKTLLVALLVSVGMMAANTVTTRSTTISSEVTVNANVDYTITASTPFSGNGTLNIPSTSMEHSVIIFKSVKPSVVISTWLKYIRINGATAVDGTNCQVRMYNKGAIVFPYSSSFSPLTCYTATNYGGANCATYTTGSDGGYMKTLTQATLLNNIKSFKLKRGYMVTFATGTAGWGYSRCFVADTEDLEMDLPAVLSGKVSSYRLFQWYNFGKSGIANNTDASVCSALNVQGCYTYNVGDGSNMPDVEWLSHKIHPYWPGVAACGANEYSCTMKTDNEPANSNDDNPATVAEVLGYWEDAMRTGMRLCSPSTHDGSKSWFDEFFAAIDARGWRCDLYDIHCYWDSFSGLSTHYNYYNRPLLISEWIWGASWNSNGAFASGVTDAQIVSNTSSILSTLNSTAYVERYFYWNSESKAKIYNGDITTLGQTYAATDGGLGYNKSYEYVPVVVMSNPYSLTGTISGNSISLAWKSPNGDMADEVRIQYKLSSASSWTTLASQHTADKTSHSDANNTYTGTLNNASNYQWRVVEVYSSTEYPSGIIQVASTSAEVANITYLPANVSDFYFQFYSKEASTDLVWAVAASGEDRVQYKAYNSNHASDLYQLWELEPNSNGGYSLRNLGEYGYLIASPASWNFVTRNSNYTVEAAQTAYGFTYNSSGDYWVCNNLYHGLYVGLWDNDKNFAAGELLAGNRADETEADHLGIRMIPRSLVFDQNVTPNSTPAAGTSYYVYNVDAGMFLTKGNSYGTHASLGSSGLKWTLSQPATGYYSLYNEDNGYLYANGQDGLWVDGLESLGVNTTGGDLTSTYLTNADFSGSTATTSTIYGYGKDGTPYGYQTVTGWTSTVVAGDNTNSSYPNSGLVGGVFSYGSTVKMQGGGYAAPSAGPDGATGNCLGLLGVWTCGGYYYQSVTVPAGSYTLTYKVYNQSGTSAVGKNYFGFIADSGTEYLSTQTTFSTGSWLTITVSFTLTASTSGKICMGYKSAGGGSGANPHLFVDNVTLLTSVTTTVTHDTQNSRFFTLTKQSDDTYVIKVDPTNPNLGTSALGNYPIGFVGDIAGTPYVLTSPRDTYHSGLGTKWLFMSESAYIVYRGKTQQAAAARQQMWPMVIAARSAGVGSDEIAVYEDPASTSEDIATAMESLKTKILAVEASEENPVDYSFLITNNDCGSSSHEGWTLDGSWGSNTSFYRNGNALLTNRFYESWVSSTGSLSDRSLSQTLNGLVGGAYQLSFDAIATKQSDASATVTGAVLFLGDQEVSCSTANGVPETFTTPTFTLKDGYPLTLGLKLESTTANWVAFDNFRLVYLGPTYSIGDITDNGEIDLDDVAALVNIILGHPQDNYNLDAADVDKSGSVTIADITALVNMIKAK